MPGLPYWLAKVGKAKVILNLTSLNFVCCMSDIMRRRVSTTCLWKFEFVFRPLLFLSTKHWARRDRDVQGRSEN